MLVRCLSVAVSHLMACKDVAINQCWKRDFVCSKCRGTRRGRENRHLEGILENCCEARRPLAHPQWCHGWVSPAQQWQSKCYIDHFSPSFSLPLPWEPHSQQDEVKRSLDFFWRRRFLGGSVPAKSLAQLRFMGQPDLEQNQPKRSPYG